MTKGEYDKAMAKACPHGPDEPCTCPGAGKADDCACSGYVVGCTCDIEWDTMHELRMDGWTDPLEISDRWYSR